MANIINTTILSEGTQKAVLQFYFESDGTDGEFVNQVLFNPSTDFNVLANNTRQQVTDPSTGIMTVKPVQMTILQMWAETSWFDIILGFSGATGVTNQWIIARDAEVYRDLRYFAGVKDRTTDPDGKLVISTKDFAPQGSVGILVMEVRKN